MSKHEQENERLRRAFGEPAERAAPSAGCPANELIWSACRGELPPERTQALLAHSLDCPACAESWKVASAMIAEQSAADIRTYRPRAPRVGHMVAAAAAALLLLLVLTPLARRQFTGADPSSAPSLDAEVRTTLWRVGAEADEALSSGDAVQPGDRLYLEVATERPVHLYVINRDTAGESFTLFPIEGAQWTNPLDAGATYRIPGDTSWKYDSWEVSSAGGRESFVVVAARAPLSALESALALLQAATPGSDWTRGEAAETSPTAAEASYAIDAALERLGGQPHDHGVVVRRIVLENPR